MSTISSSPCTAVPPCSSICQLVLLPGVALHACLCLLKRLGNDGRQFSGSPYAQLFVHVIATVHHRDIGNRYSKFSGEKSYHVVGRPARDRRLGNADPQLLALHLADGILPGTRRSKDIQHQRITVPHTERGHLPAPATRVF